MENKKLVDHLLVDYFEVDKNKINEDTRLIEDLGFDSLDSVDMLVVLESKVKTKIDPNDFRQCKTLSDVYQVVEKIKSEKTNISA